MARPKSRKQQRASSKKSLLEQPLDDGKRDDLEAVHVTDEDLEFVRDHGEFTSAFLQHPSANGAESSGRGAVNQRKRVRHGEEDEDEETVYERRGRRDFQNVECDQDPDAAAGRLPIKDHVHGTWKKNTARPVDVVQPGGDDIPDGGSDVSSASEHDFSETVEVESVNEELSMTGEVGQSPTGTTPTRPPSFSDKRQSMALLATSIIEDPETHIGKLKELRAYAKDRDQRMVKLVLLTQLSIFQDIIPGYRIRELTEKERTTKVSKEVKKTRQYEEAILQHYQAYLQQLASIAQEHAPSSSSSSSSLENTTRNVDLLHLAMKCFCELLTNCGHFNFRVNIMSAVVSRMNLRIANSDDPDGIGLLCCATVEQMFREDEAGENSLDCVKLIAQLVKSKKYHVHPRVLDTFQALRLTEEAVNMQDAASVANSRHAKSKLRSKQQQTHVSKRQKKKLKVDVELQQELKEAEAVVDKEERQKLFTETLKHVFVTYFRILKHAPDSILLRSVLAGIARYGHMISVDYFDDVLRVIRGILQDHYEDLSLVESLHCVLTVLTLMGGHGEKMVAVDLTFFYRMAYQLLMEAPMRLSDGREEVNTDSNGAATASLDEEESVVRLIIRCVEGMFLKRGKQDVAPTRTAAFTKRLLLLATVVQSVASCLALVECVRMLLMRAPTKCHQLLEGEEQRVADAGVYLPELDDPELCHPFAAGLWEWAVLAEHWHPAVRQRVREYCQGPLRQLVEGGQASASMGLRALMPLEALDLYAMQGGCAFNPSMSTLQPHKMKKSHADDPNGPLCRRSVPMVTPLASSMPTTMQQQDDHDGMDLFGELFQQQRLEQKRGHLRRLRRHTTLFQTYFRDTTQEKE